MNCPFMFCKREYGELARFVVKLIVKSVDDRVCSKRRVGLQCLGVYERKGNTLCTWEVKRQ